jgi:hypothetical protein
MRSDSAADRWTLCVQGTERARRGCECGGGRVKRRIARACGCFARSAITDGSVAPGCLSDFGGLPIRRHSVAFEEFVVAPRLVACAAAGRRRCCDGVRDVVDPEVGRTAGFRSRAALPTVARGLAGSHQCSARVSADRYELRVWCVQPFCGDIPGSGADRADGRALGRPGTANRGKRDAVSRSAGRRWD